MNDALRQQQFLDVIDRDEAERRFRAALDLRPLEAEIVPLSEALGRVLAAEVVAPLDVPNFDRSNVDGFAVQAADTFGASEDRPRALRLNDETLATGIAPRVSVASGTATAIATGAMLPRGADAVVMIEYTDVRDEQLLLTRPVAPGANLTFAGTDIGQGEVVLRRGQHLTSRETGVLAALGIAQVSVVRRPRVAILSTGDELIAPGAAMKPGMIFDSNATVLADAVRELGCEPVPLGIVPDDRARLMEVLQRSLVYDAILLSGGTSKGAGDVSYRAVADLGSPGIVAHGVALKPGKPLCLAVVQREERRPIPVAVLPGFPTSAIFTFHEFLAPVLQQMAGRRERSAGIVPARLPLRVNSERGRTEYLLVGLVEYFTAENAESAEKDKTNNEAKANTIAASIPETSLLPYSALSAFSAVKYSSSTMKYIAYPMGKGSGSVTAFGRADGFVIIPRQREYLERDSIVSVHLLDADIQPADLVVIGSHCTGLDYLLGELHGRGVTSKVLAVGSTGGLEAAKRGECDLAGIHLLDPQTDTYNWPFLSDTVELLPGYGRTQGIVFRHGDTRFEGRDAAGAVAAALGDAGCALVNRNRGSGTRILIDGLLGTARPAGYLTEARSHNAVAAAVVQGRADWGVAIEPVAHAYGLGFVPLRAEEYDFVIPKARRDRPAVQAFIALLADSATRRALTERGFHPSEPRA
ncbi:MAG TPA: molybdopterin biosynthesis protein [Gemmataceae bacterium]|nr:molybdopterin biosynthesis protein [Gemmataceae bacterium]